VSFDWLTGRMRNIQFAQITGPEILGFFLPLCVFAWYLSYLIAIALWALAGKITQIKSTKRNEK